MRPEFVVDLFWENTHIHVKFIVYWVEECVWYVHGKMLTSARTVTRASRVQTMMPKIRGARMNVVHQ